jgi:hypothetical protein
MYVRRLDEGLIETLAIIAGHCAGFINKFSYKVNPSPLTEVTHTDPPWGRGRVSSVSPPQPTIVHRKAVALKGPEGN